MDSGSGSLQSSSGADEEYDSHHHHHQQQQPQIFPPPPLFFNNNIPSSNSQIISSSSSSIIPQQLPFHLSHHNYQTQQFHPPNFYDLPSTHFNFNPDSSNSFFNNNNLDVNLRSNPTTTDFKNDQNPNPNQIRSNNQTPSSSGVLQPKPTTTTKKRTRASRRAPTTVLTTDTTNFRAMVQEFTGIPSPPFTAGGGSSYSRRFDLFGSIRSTNLEAGSGSGSGSGLGTLYPACRSKIQLFDVAAAEQRQQQITEAEIFSFPQQQPQIHGTNQQLVNDDDDNGGGGGNCKLNFRGNYNLAERDKEILLGNIIVSSATTRGGESTVDSWICPTAD